MIGIIILIFSTHSITDEWLSQLAFHPKTSSTTETESVTTSPATPIARTTTTSSPIRNKAKNRITASPDSPTTNSATASLGAHGSIGAVNR